MTGINNNDLKQYSKQIKTLLPLNVAPEKRFIADLESSMRDYVRENPSCNISDFHDNFGSPSEIITNYYETMDTKRLTKRIRTAKWIRTTCIIVLALAFASSIFHSVLAYKDYKAGENAHVTVIEETIIE